jgi:hypothetical protein
MKKISLKNLAIAAICAVSFGACVEDATNEHIINGQVTDELNSPINNVTVVIQSGTSSFTTKTDSAGKYQFEELPLGIYDISFSKEGFKTNTDELNVVWNRNMEYDCSLTNTMGITVGGKAQVVVTDYLTISDGIALLIEKNTNTQNFYLWCDKSDVFTDFSDIEMVNFLIQNNDGNILEPYWTQINPNTEYTVFIAAFDSQGQTNGLIKKYIKTKPANNQPVANITITNAGNGEMKCSINKNAKCSKWAYACFHKYSDVNALLNEYDIELAIDAYINSKDPKYLSTNNESMSFSGLEGFAIIVTLGFDANGNNSGIIDKKIFNAATGQIYNAPSAVASKVRKEGVSAKCRANILQQIGRDHIETK